MNTITKELTGMYKIGTGEPKRSHFNKSVNKSYGGWGDLPNKIGEPREVNTNNSFYVQNSKSVVLRKDGVDYVFDTIRQASSHIGCCYSTLRSRVARGCKTAFGYEIVSFKKNNMKKKMKNNLHFE